MSQPARPSGQRKADTLTKLATATVDVWVATASVDEGGDVLPHLVPLSLAWLEDERCLIAVDGTSRTARNLMAHSTARLAVGPTRDVVMIEAALDEVHDVEAADWLGERYARQADWDPRGSPGYLFLVLRPMRIQAWREANEIAGRTLMRGGRWLV